MFHGSSDKANRIQVALTLADGTVQTVSIRLPLSGKLHDALNNQDRFLDVVTASGQQEFIAKDALRSVRQAVVPKADQLDAEGRGTGGGSLDPYAVLKVPKGAGADEIRQAYHRMARLYHPDRIASYELPDEIKAYARDMLVRINLAFEQIGS